MCFSKAILSYNIAFFSPPDGIQRISVRFTGVPSWKYQCVASVLFLTCLLNHLFRLVVHSLSFRRSVFHSTTAVLLNHISRDWRNVVVVLIELCWTPRRFHISSTAAIDYTNFPVSIAVRTLLFGEISAKFEDLGVVQVGNQILRFFAELVDRLLLAQVLKEWFLMFVVLELLDQLLDLVLECCILLLDCRKSIQIFCNLLCCYKFHRNLSNRLLVSPMILRLGFVDLADYITSSILARTFWYSSSCIFIFAAFSMQAANSVLWRTTACDHVW